MTSTLDIEQGPPDCCATQEHLVWPPIDVLLQLVLQLTERPEQHGDTQVKGRREKIRSSFNIDHVIEPTSQDAMAWKSSVNAGHYQNHAGRCVPLYYYPKPWEALNTRARPDFVKQDDMGTMPAQ